MNAILMCDTDHYLVLAKVRERLTMNKQISLRFHMERFNVKKFNEVDYKEQYRVEVSNRYAALEDLDAEVEINSASSTLQTEVTRSSETSTWHYIPEDITSHNHRCENLKSSIFK
jgi:hypothetical protein